MWKRISVAIFTIFTFHCAISGAQDLEAYIQQGLQNSPLLKDYQNQIQSGLIDSSIINAQRKPQVNGLGLLWVEPSDNNWGYDQAVTNTGTYSATIAVTQGIFAKKIYAPQYGAIRIQQQYVNNTSRISEHDLKKSITDQYLTAYASLNQLIYSQSIYTLLKDEELLLQKFVEQGVYKQTDYLSFKIAVKSQEILIKQSQMQYKTDLRQLNLICGINDTAYHLIASPDIKAYPSKEKNTSPFLMQFKIDSLSITNQRDMVNTKYHPRVNWFADAGLVGSNPALLYKNFGASFGLNFSVPIYDGKQKKLQYQKLSINESTRTNYQQFFRNQYNQRIIQLTAQLTENEQLIAAIQAQLLSSETLINMSKQLLNKGELSVTDFIITIKNYIDIKSQLNQSQLQKLQLINELNYWNW